MILQKLGNGRAALLYQSLLRLALAGFMAVGWISFAGAADSPAFEALIKAAKQEGTVVVDGPPLDEVREAITKGFAAKYGIEVSYISSGSSKSGARVRAERAAGKYLLDVFISGSDTPILTFLPAGWLDPMAPILIDPEVTDTSKWHEGHIWFGDPDRTILRILRYVTPALTINTKLVGPGEVVSWKNVLEPRWQGKIIAKDPAVSGAGASLIGYFYLTFGPDFVKALYKDQKPSVSRDPRQAAQFLALGNYAIGVGLDQNEIIRFQNLGYPLQFTFPTDSPDTVTGGWGFVNLINKAPHPNAAKLFVNWLASREGQELFARATYSVGLRTDIDQSWTPAHTIPKDGKVYMDTYDYKFVREQRDSAFEKAKQLLGF
jgi:iron(III) transport system substrate-binding protein